MGRQHLVEQIAAKPTPNKSWKTSHLERLGQHELDGVLHLMRGWYQDTPISFNEYCDWPLLWEYIDRNGLGGVLGSTVLDNLCSIPPEFAQMATHRYFSNQVQYEQDRQLCLTISKAAKELHIPVRILKGPAVVAQGYQDTGVRSFSDLDLFTDSLASAQRLCDYLHGSVHRSFAEQNVLQRLGECECFSFLLAGREVECRYPLNPPGEPMFELLLRHQNAFLQIPGQAEEILLPPPDLHLVFLIQHMVIHHLYSRFFWFLDLAVMVRNSPQIDYHLVNEELQRLGLSNAAFVAGQFCRAHIDKDFPAFTGQKPAWNNKMMEKLAVPENIASGRFGIYHEKFIAKAFGYLIGAVSFYLIADPVKFPLSLGTRWTLNRLKNSCGIRRSLPGIDCLLGSIIAVAMWPLAFALSIFTGIRKDRGIS